MKVRLVDPMPLHPLLCYPGTRRPLRAIGLSTDGLPVWPLLGADGEDEDKGEDDEGDEGGEDEEEDADEDAEDKGDDEGKKTKKRTGPVPREEFERVKNHLSKADQKKAALEKENAELKKFKDEQERKGNTELQNIKKDLEGITRERDTYRDRFTAMARTNAFLTASQQLKVVWHDPTDAQAAAGKELRDLEIDEDGNVEGIKELVKDLAKRKKYLVNTGDSDDEDDGDKKRGASGSGVGSVKTKSNGKKGQLSPEELRKRFPQLKR